RLTAGQMARGQEKPAQGLSKSAAEPLAHYHRDDLVPGLYVGSPACKPSLLMARGALPGSLIPCACALSLSRAPLDFEVSSPALPASTADVGFVGEVPDP